MTENNPYAGFWKRLAAAFIDSIILFIFIQIIEAFVSPIIMESLIAQAQETATLPFLGGAVVYFMIFPLIIVLYFALFESSSKQATLGKQLLKIKVVDYNGKRLSLLRALGRTFSKILSMIPLYVGFIMVGASQKKQALHDKIAKTYVVNKDYKEGDTLPLLANTGCMIALTIVVGISTGLFILFVLLNLLSGNIHINKPSDDPNQEFVQSLNRLYSFHMSRQGANLQQNSNGVRFNVGGSSKYGIVQMGNYLFIMKDKDVSMMMVGHPELAFRIINNNQVCCEPRAENACDIVQGIEICPAK